MEKKGFAGCALIAGAFIIVFTFVAWPPAKWIIFAFGVALILHAFMGNCYKDMCKTKTKMPIKKIPVKKK